MAVWALRGHLSRHRCVDLHNFVKRAVFTVFDDVTYVGQASISVLVVVDSADHSPFSAKVEPN